MWTGERDLATSTVWGGAKARSGATAGRPASAGRAAAVGRVAAAARVALVAGACGLAGCSELGWSGKKTLYDRLGGEKAIAAVVDDFVNRSAGNPRVNFTRKGTGKEWAATPEHVARLKKLLTEQICEATGGPQKYTGRDMRTVHAGMRITSEEFGALAADLKESLNKFKVPAKEQDELMAIVASTKGDIVEE